MIYISIVLSAYNHEKSILQCLDSIIAQENADMQIECIVVDDCSTDNSFAIAESFIPKFGGQMTLLKLEKNTGCEGSAPRNVGLKNSHGEYIFFVDADDTTFQHLYQSPVSEL